MNNSDDKELLAIANKIVKEMKQGETEKAIHLIDELTRVRESEIFQKVGKLTRNMHNSIVEMGADGDVSKLSKQVFPDAKERLNHVIEMTENSAHQTMQHVENSIALLSDINAANISLSSLWNELLKDKGLSEKNIVELNKKLSDNFENNKNKTDELNNYMTEILVAQGAQDLSGQIIKKVIQLVDEVEEQLVELLEFTASDSEDKSKNKGSDIEADGPAMPSDKDRAQDQDDVDDILAKLGF